MKTYIQQRVMACMTCFLLAAAFMFLPGTATVQAQIYEPDGLRMPGDWNGWSNSTGMGGPFDLVKIYVGTPRWQTTFQYTGTTGPQQFKFVSTGWGNPWNNQWAGNQLCVIGSFFDVFFGTPSDPNNVITVNQNMWYTVLFKDLGYTSTQAVFMATSAEPVSISSVSMPEIVHDNDPVTITITTSGQPSPEEFFYIRYTTDNWATSFALPVVMNGTTGTAVIGGQPEGTMVSYYAFSSTVPALTSDFDMYTIRFNLNNGSNYYYIVTASLPAITFANLDFPAADTIETGESLYVYGHVTVPGMTGQVLPAPGMEAWVGFSTDNTDPSGWTNWIPASYFQPIAGSDQFRADLGAAIANPGIYFFATRYRFYGGSFMYGGFSPSGGGFWDGTSNISGALVVVNPEVPLLRTLDDIIVAAEQIVCYDAKQTITVGDFVVQPFGEATLVAGVNVVFMPGLVVAEGGHLLAYITETGNYCTTPDHPEVTAAAGSENPEITALKAWPNPADGLVTFSLTRPGKGISSLTITDIRGKIVCEASIPAHSTLQINFSDLPAGIYIAKVSGMDMPAPVKIVKR